jgi:hypothetical protein
VIEPCNSCHSNFHEGKGRSSRFDELQRGGVLDKNTGPQNHFECNRREQELLMEWLKQASK